MKDYYQILGLEPSASEQEIKRAYFKLIRKYAPETDAEKFQEIREAYEYLKSHPCDEFILPLPKDKFAKNMVERIEEYIKYRDYEAAMECCEEGIRYFSEEFYFPYQLGQCQIYNRNTGNAIRTFQNMIQRYPKEKECVRGLAIAYYKRGYYKKAIPYFEQANQMGCNDIGFIIDYCSALDEASKYHEITDIIFNFFEQEKYIAKNQMEEYLAVFSLLLETTKHGEKNEYQKAATIFLDFLEQNRGGFGEYASSVVYLILSYIRNYSSSKDEQLEEVKKQLKEEIKLFGLDKNTLKQVDRNVSFHYLEEDPRIQEDIVRYLSIFIDTTCGLEEEDLRFAKVDTELCILERCQQALSEFDIIKQEYPILYETIEKFVTTIRNTNSLQYQKEKRLKEFNAKKMFYPFHCYQNNCEEMYNDWMKDHNSNMEAPWLDEIDSAWEENTPYVRTEKKVGRNDPCPCGSGLKYKKCCGR